MKKIHNECVNCNLPCMGDSCPNRKVARYYCDNCEREDVLYKYEGQELCFECLLKEINADLVDESYF